MPSSGETTVFVYDAFGKLVAEYSTALASVQQVSYMTADHLGSPRVMTNENGAVTNRKDFAAFGDEVVSAQRVSGGSGNGYTPDEVRKDYTGYEKDSESGLQFAQARYYNTTHGRFTSVDPLTASASIKNPQTFNRYSYVLNSPYKFVDPLGLLSITTGADGGGFCSASNSSCDEGAEITTQTQEKYRKEQLEKQEKKDEARRARREAKKKQAAQKPKPPPLPSNPAASENVIARMFGDIGAYFSNPNDGDPVDQTIGIARNAASSRTDPENHLYPSATDPSANSGFYVPDGGKYAGEYTYTEDSGEDVHVIGIYFAELGGLRDITIAVFHLINIDTSMPRGKDGRRKLGDLGEGAGGGWGYASKGAKGKIVFTQGVHAHLEIYRGRHRSLPQPGHKPHTNFNGVIP